MRKPLRLLKLNLIVEEFFRTTNNIDDARRSFWLPGLYPDMTPNESAAIEARGEAIIEAAVLKIVSERKLAAEQGKGTEDPEENEDSEGLTEEEAKKGVQLRRVDPGSPKCANRSLRGHAGRRG